MSRITRALKKAQQDSIPHRRTELFDRLSEELLAGLSRPFRISFLYSDPDPAYTAFIGRFAAHVAGHMPVSVVSENNERFSGLEVSVVADPPEEGSLIFDNREQDGSRIVFLVNKTDFFIYQSFPPERVLGAVLIR